MRTKSSWLNICNNTNTQTTIMTHTTISTTTAWQRDLTTHRQDPPTTQDQTTQTSTIATAITINQRQAIKHIIRSLPGDRHVPDTLRITTRIRLRATPLGSHMSQWSTRTTGLMNTAIWLKKLIIIKATRATLGTKINMELIQHLVRRRVSMVRGMQEQRGCKDMTDMLLKVFLKRASSMTTIRALTDTLSIATAILVTIVSTLNHATSHTTTAITSCHQMALSKVTTNKSGWSSHKKSRKPMSTSRRLLQGPREMGDIRAIIPITGQMDSMEHPTDMLRMTVREIPKIEAKQ